MTKLDKWEILNTININTWFGLGNGKWKKCKEKENKGCEDK